MNQRKMICYSSTVNVDQKYFPMSMRRWEMFSLSSHVETTFTMVSGLFLAFSIVLNERLGFPKFSLIKDSLIQVFILNFLFFFFFFFIALKIYICLWVYNYACWTLYISLWPFTNLRLISKVLFDPIFWKVLLEHNPAEHVVRQMVC